MARRRQRYLKPGSANPHEDKGMSDEDFQKLIDEGLIYPNGILTPAGELKLHQLRLKAWMAEKYKKQQEQQQQERADDDHP